MLAHTKNEIYGHRLRFSKEEGLPSSDTGIVAGHGDSEKLFDQRCLSLRQPAILHPVHHHVKVKQAREDVVASKFGV